MTGPGCGIAITHPAHSNPSMLRKSTPSLMALCACLMVAVGARCHGVSFCRTHIQREREGEQDRGRLTALVQYDTPSLLQLPDDWSGAVAGSLDDIDALVDDGLGVSAIVRRVKGRQEGDVDTERVLGHRPALLDLLAQVGWGWEDEAGDDAKPAGVGDCAGQLGVPDVLEQEPGVSISSWFHGGEAAWWPRLIEGRRRAMSVA